MTKKYNKGDVVELTHKWPNVAGDVGHVVGIILKISNTELTLAHNFLESNPIDITVVPLRNILGSQKIIPKEINFLRDLKNLDS